MLFDPAVLASALLKGPLWHIHFRVYSTQQILESEIASSGAPDRATILPDFEAYVWLQLGQIGHISLYCVNQ